MQLRPAKPSDATAIADYHVAAWAEAYTGMIPQATIDELTVERRLVQWQEWLADSVSTVIVADVDGVAVGHVLVSGNELFQLYLDPRHLGKGYGLALLQAATEELRAGGIATAFLTTLNVRTQPAFQLYVSHGWVPGAVEPAEVCGGAESVRMSLDLSN